MDVAEVRADDVIQRRQTYLLLSRTAEYTGNWLGWSIAKVGDSGLVFTCTDGVVATVAMMRLGFGGIFTMCLHRGFKETF